MTSLLLFLILNMLVFLNANLPSFMLLLGVRGHNDITSASCQGGRQHVLSAGVELPGACSGHGQSAGAAGYSPSGC